MGGGAGETKQIRLYWFHQRNSHFNYQLINPDTFCSITKREFNNDSIYENLLFLRKGKNRDKFIFFACFFHFYLCSSYWLGYVFIIMICLYLTSSLVTLNHMVQRITQFNIIMMHNSSPRLPKYIYYLHYFQYSFCFLGGVFVCFFYICRLVDVLSSPYV